MGCCAALCIAVFSDVALGIFTLPVAAFLGGLGTTWHVHWCCLQHPQGNIRSIRPSVGIVMVDEGARDAYDLTIENDNCYHLGTLLTF